MKIEIKHMELRNFKKIREQKIDFCHDMLISGENKTGKTTIYDAYLWAIFGVTSKKNSIVQPLDTYNNIIHHLETSVTVVLKYNDEREIKVQRILTENWKNIGTADEKLLNITHARLIDDISLSQKAFNEKLEELCPIDKWIMLSNINIFMSCKTDDRRKMLISLANGINEEELMKRYPLVYKGVVIENKKLADMILQQKNIKKKSEDELKLIPIKAQAQEILRVNADFTALKIEKENIDKQIFAIDASLEGSVGKDPGMNEYIAKLQFHNANVAKAQKEWQDNKVKSIDDLIKKITESSNVLSDANKILGNNLDSYNSNKVKLTEVSIKFEQKIKEWKNVNEKEFNYEQTDVCPVCGRPYTDDMKTEEYNNAVEEFNKNKAEMLTKLQNEASEYKQQMTVLKGNISTYEQITKANDENAVKKANALYCEYINQREDKQNQTWETSAEKLALDKEYAFIEAQKPNVKVNTSVVENKKKKISLIIRRDEIMKQLYGEEINRHIDNEKEKLNARSVELAQKIADSTKVINQINAYEKAKISMIEDEVNSYFFLIRWKFSEHNKTKDEDKEICMAIDAEGIDYDNANDGTVINMGVDIIEGISKALDIYVPLFVDRKESAENIMPIKQQTIFLQCVFGQPLKIESYK